MDGDVFVDTNVLVYAYDGAEPPKQEQALRVLRRLAVSGRGRLSVQVLGEFFRAVTQKHRPRMTPADAHAQVALLLRAWPTLSITPLIALEAARGVRDHRLSYWDAQIWATVRLHQITVVLSEDFRNGLTLEGVTFRDPFARTFDLATIQ